MQELLVIHDMKLNPLPFQRIKDGTKILELRLFDEKRRKINLGDQIRFFKLPQQDESLNVEVTGLLIYPDFRSLLDDVPASFLGYQEHDKAYTLTP